MNLPTDISPDDFDGKYIPAFDQWRDAVLEICREHNLACNELQPFKQCSNLVAAVGGEWVVKIFPPFHRNQWESERRLLPPLRAASPVPVPELLAQGERADGYLYVVIGFLPGVTLEDRWPDLDRDNRAQIMRRIGEVMAGVHAHPVGDLVDLPPAFPEFLVQQIADCKARQERGGAPDWVVQGVDEFVGPALEFLELDATPVILTGEYTPFNLLVDDGPDGTCGLSAMIDFGDGMVGPAVYDLLGPIAFLGGGDPKLLQPFFEGYGHLPWPLGSGQRQGLLALLLAHRYSYLKAQLRMDGWTDCGNLEQLADHIFGA
jgi:hygromycin-B 7''-O-kinase